MVVSGANGFLGSYVVAALLNQGHTVTGIKRKDSDTSYFSFILKNELQAKFDELIKNFTWKDADILDICALDEIMDGEDIVFHCAAKVAFNEKAKEEMLAINRDGTANVVNACLKNNIRKLVYVSSTAALGRSEVNEKITENRDWTDSDQNTNYAVSKHLAELEVWRGIEEGLDAVIVNPGIILGAGNWTQGSCKLFHNVYNGFRFYTKGVNGYVSARDVANAMVQLSACGITAQRFLLVAENRSYQSLFFAIADAFNKARPHIELKKTYRKLLMFIARILQFVNPRTTVTPETVNTSMKVIEYESSKIKQAIGFNFTPIDECIKDTVAAYPKTFLKERT